MPSLTIEQVRAAKDELGNKIAKQIKEFEESTSCQIGSINLLRNVDMTGKSHVTSVTLEVSILSRL